MTDALSNEVYTDEAGRSAFLGRHVAGPRLFLASSGPTVPVLSPVGLVAMTVLLLMAALFVRRSTI